MAKKKLTYQSALDEIESIVDEIENGNPDVDKLGAKITRAIELVKYCKEGLRATNDQIEIALNELNDE